MGQALFDPWRKWPKQTHRYQPGFGELCGHRFYLTASLKTESRE